MASDAATPRELPPVRTCGSYRYGHDVHFIQARLSLEEGPGEPRVVAAVGDDGTVTFTDGTSVWNHGPARLRTAVEWYGPDVLVASRGVLRVAHTGGAYCFSVITEPDPCRPETAEMRPGETILDELLRRGGVLRSMRSVRAEIEAAVDSD